MPIVTLAGPGSRLYAAEEGGGEDLIFAMDYSADPTLGGGWETVGGGYDNPNGMSPDFVVLSRIAGGGPSGQDCYRWTWVNNDTEQQGTLGFYGGDSVLSAAVWPAGTTMFFSFRFRYVPGSNPPSGPKVIITSADDGAYGSGSRPILQVQDWDTGYVHRMSLGAEAYEYTQTPIPKNYEDGPWERLQWAVTASTDTTTSDGRQRLWLDADNDVEASPTVDWDNILVPRAATKWNTGLPLYWSNLPTGYSSAIEICDYQIRTAFRVMS